MMKQIFLVVVLLAGLLTNRAFGQGGTTGAISGIVTDSAGAVIPGAQVKATHTSTSVANQTTTNEAGVYTFPYLQLGQYDVQVSAKGMKDTVIKDVKVDEGNISRVDASLQVGAANETVQVTEQAPLLEQESTTIDASVDQKLINDLPSVAGGGTRAASDIVAILPGVQVPGASSGNSYGSQFGVNVGGGRQFGTEFQMDGMSLAYQGISADVPLDMRPDYDLTSEVKVQQGVPTAEFGRTTGGVVTFLSRSGTNEFHGNAGVFIKNTVFDAHPYNSDTVTTDQNWEMPLSVGGPIWIPKIYDGRGKSFFFFNSTTYRQKSASLPGTVTVPTAQERTGNFNDRPEIIYDPTTGLPFPGNQIPTSRFSTVAAAINAFYPAPSNSNVSNNRTGVTPSSVLQNDQFVRVDQKITDSNHLMASYRHRNEPTIYAEGGPFGPVLSGDTSPRSLHQDTIQDDWTISPRIVNHFAIGDVGFTTSQTNNPLGDPKYYVPVPGSFGPGFPGFCFQTQDYYGLGNGLGNCTTGVVNYEVDRTRDIQDTVFWNKGAHSIKLGLRYMWFQAASGTKSGYNGYYYFSGAETAQVVNGSPQAVTTGNSYASFLLGLVNSANMQQLDSPDTHQQTLGIYAEDQWRVRKNLSVNFGLRWDIEPPAYDTQNRLSAMNPATPNLGAGGLPGAYTFAPQLHVRNFTPTWYGGWAPRFGAAYSVKPDLIVRASFGVLLGPPIDGLFTDSTGFSGSKTVSSFNGGVTPAMTWDTGWTNVVRPPSFDPTQQNGGSANIANPGANRWPATNQWTLDVQKSFARDFAVTVSYVGQNTHHMAGGYPANQVNPGYLSLGGLLTQPITSPAVVAAGYNAPFPGFTTLYGTSVPLAQALKPFPQYQTVNDLGNRLFGANYNAFMIMAEHRFAQGFQYLISYTGSKTLSNITLNDEEPNPGPQNAYNLKAEKYLAPFDIPKALVMSYTYELPWGPGRPWLNHGLLSNILGGWATSGILTYDAGIPVLITVPNTLPLGNSRLNAQYLGGATKVPHGKIIIGGNVGATPATVVLNKAAFAQPAPYTFGNAYVLPSTRTAGYKSENASFFKRETFYEKYIFELRFDMINLPNRKVPTALDSGLTDAGFGTYGGSAIGPRTCQLDAKITF